MLDDNEQKMSDTMLEALPLTMPLSRIGPVAVECAESIEQQFGEDARVLAVIVVAEVLAQNSHGDYIDSIEYSSNERRRWVQLALLNEAATKAERLNEARVEEVDDAFTDVEDD